MTDILETVWLQSLCDDVKAIHVEGIFVTRWTLIETYHQIGKRIVNDENWQKWQTGNADKLSRVTELTGIADRDLRRAIQFYEMYPCPTADLVYELPDGKNISWHKIVNNLLPAKTEGGKDRPMRWYMERINTDYLTALLDADDERWRAWAREGLALRQEIAE